MGALGGIVLGLILYMVIMALPDRRDPELAMELRASSTENLRAARQRALSAYARGEVTASEADRAVQDFDAELASRSAL